MGNPKIFLSYRRGDSAGYTDSLYKNLVERYGREAVFYDRTRIEPGARFPDTIHTAVSRAEVALVVIGQRWLTIADDEGGRRLDDPDDWVVAEIELALAGGAEVVPVLVEGASMPAVTELPEPIQSLAARQAMEVSPSRWDEDLKRLRHAIDRWLLGRRRRLPLASALVAAVAAIGIASIAWVANLAAVPGAGWPQRMLERGLGRQVPAVFGGDAVALVVIDDEDLSVADRREAYAELVTVLSEAGTAVVALDAYFDWDLETARSDADTELADAIAVAHCHGTDVVVASKFATVAAPADKGSAHPNFSQTPLPEWLRDSVGDRWGYVSLEGSAGVGGSFLRAELGRLKYRSKRARSGDLWPTLPLRAVMQVLDATIARYNFESGEIDLCRPRPDPSAAAGLACDSPTLERVVAIPVERVSKKVAPLHPTPLTKKSPKKSADILLLPLHLAPEEQFSDRTRKVSFRDRNRKATVVDELRRARKQFIIIGSTREGTHEAFDGLQGFRVHAQVASNILAGHFLRPAGSGIVLPLIAVAALLGSVWRRRQRRPLEISEPSSPYKHWGWSSVDLAVGGLGLTVVSYLAALLAFMSWQMIVPLPYLLLAFATAYLLLATIERRRAA